MDGSGSTILFVAVFAASAATAHFFILRNACVLENTCSSRGSSRTFSTVLALRGALLYGSGENVSIGALTQGYCGLGERFQLSITGQPACVVLWSFPDALDASIGNPDGATDHDVACGEWIESGSVSGATAAYRAFSDSDERATAVRRAEASQHAGARLSSSNMGKFRAACDRAVLGGSAALRAAGVLAYEHLVAEASIDAVSDEASVLAATGMLTSFYCDGPVLFGWELHANGFETSVRRGVPFGADALFSALALVGASPALQAEAELANSRVNELAWSSPATTTEQLAAVLMGGTGRDATNANVTSYAYTPELDGLLALLNTSIAQARAYLKGVASMCAFSLESLAVTPGYTTTARGAADWLRGANAQRPRATALGHLEPPDGAEPMFEVDGVAELNASTITISQLVGATDGDACLSFTRFLFPDEVDQLHFGLVVPPVLYKRMEAVVAQVRTGVAAVLRTNAAVRAALVDPDAVALDVEATRVRIPGAPRGSWAGSSRAIPRAALESGDGVFVMAARQARTLWRDRQDGLAHDALHPCEGPSPFSPLIANAYIYPAYLCSYFLLGMSWAPFADAAYDEASLVSRFGYIIAHELAHTSLNTPYQAAGKAALLARYPCDSSHDEAWADLLGVLGVLNTGLVNSSKLCQHVSQSWCARTPTGFDEAGCGGQSHPRANVRGDRLCQTLRDLGV